MDLDSELVNNYQTKANIERNSKCQFKDSKNSFSKNCPDNPHDLYRINPKSKYQLLQAESRPLDPRQKAEANGLNKIPNLSRQNTFTSDSNPNRLCNKQQKTFLPRRENTMIPITRNINPPKVPPKPAMINFVRTNTSTLNNPKSQTMQSTGNFSLNKKIKNSMSSHTISTHKPVPNRSPSLEFEKYKSEQSDGGAFYLEANKLKLSYRPSSDIKEKKTLKFSKFWKKTEETKYLKDFAGTNVETNLISGTDSERESAKGKSEFSKKLRNFGLKKSAASSAHKKLLTQPDQNDTPNKLGNSIVLLSPNDTEMLGHSHKTKKQRIVAHTNENKSPSVLPRLSKIPSTRENLTPIINNPRNKFIQPRRGASYTRSNPNRQGLRQSKDTCDKGKNDPGASSGSATVTLV